MKTEKKRARTYRKKQNSHHTREERRKNRLSKRSEKYKKKTLLILLIRCLGSVEVRRLFKIHSNFVRSSKQFSPFFIRSLLTIEHILISHQYFEALETPEKCQIIVFSITGNSRP